MQGVEIPFFVKLFFLWRYYAIISRKKCNFANGRGVMDEG